MGKGSKDTTRLVKGHKPDNNIPKGLGSPESRAVPNSQQSNLRIPPGIPKCDVILKDSKRFWYLEPALFLFGIVGMLISAIMLLRYYLIN